MFNIIFTGRPIYIYTVFKLFLNVADQISCVTVFTASVILVMNSSVSVENHGAINKLTNIYNIINKFIYY